MSLAARWSRSKFMVLAFASSALIGCGGPEEEEIPEEEEFFELEADLTAARSPTECRLFRTPKSTGEMELCWNWSPRYNSQGTFIGMFGEYYRGILRDKKSDGRRVCMSMDMELLNGDIRPFPNYVCTTRDGLVTQTFPRKYYANPNNPPGVKKISFRACLTGSPKACSKGGTKIPHP